MKILQQKLFFNVKFHNDTYFCKISWFFDLCKIFYEFLKLFQIAKFLQSQWTKLIQSTNLN